MAPMLPYTLDSPPTLATATEVITTEKGDLFGGHRRRGHPLSPISPAKSLENLPPTTPTEEYHSGDLTSIRGRLLEYKGYTYPSPPSTASDPKHPVPLPSSTTPKTTPTNSNTNPSLYDNSNDTPYDFFPPVSPGALLDSPTMVQLGSIHHRNHNERHMRDSLSQHGLSGLQSIAEEDLDCQHSDLGIGGQTRQGDVLPPAKPPLSPTSPLLEWRGAMYPTRPTRDAPNTPLSPISPERQSEALDALPPTSGASFTDSGRHIASHHSPWTYSTSPLSTSRPSLPLLEIPDSEALYSHSYAPSPTSPLWLADDLDSLHLSNLGLPSPPGSDDTPDAFRNESWSSGSEAEHGGDMYTVSPPSSGPPDTPSPLLPFSDLSEDGGVRSAQGLEGHLIAREKESIPHIPELFEYPSSPSVSIRSLGSESGVLQFEAKVDERCSPPWNTGDVEGGRSEANWGFREDTEMFDPELLHSPSVRFRECMMLPDDDDLRHPLPECPSPSRSDAAMPNVTPCQHGSELLLLGPPTALGSGDEPDLLFPDDSPTPPPLRLDLDSHFDLNNVDSDTMKRLPPQEVEEVRRLAELQARADECERIAKDLEAKAAQSVTSEEERQGQAGCGGSGEKYGEEDMMTLREAAVEARALAKREREKAREAGMLVKLKLMETGEDIMSEEAAQDTSVSAEEFQPLFSTGDLTSLDHSGRSSSPSTLSRRVKHSRLGGVAHLVAKMFLNRPDSSLRGMPTLPSSSQSIPLSSSSLVSLNGKPTLTSGSSDSPSSPSSSLCPSKDSSSPCPRSPSRLSAAPTPKISPYKYKHLWMKCVTAAGLPLPGRSGFGTLDKLGPGATRQQPFAPYQRRYKFLRSSPLAKYSVVASHEDGEEEPENPLVLDKVRGHGGEEGDVGALWDDLEDDLDGGFEALRNPIMWDDI